MYSHHSAAQIFVFQTERSSCVAAALHFPWYRPGRRFTPPLTVCLILLSSFVWRFVIHHLLSVRWSDVVMTSSWIKTTNYSYFHCLALPRPLRYGTSTATSIRSYEPINQGARPTPLGTYILLSLVYHSSRHRPSFGPHLCVSNWWRARLRIAAALLVCVRVCDGERCFTGDRKKT